MIIVNPTALADLLKCPYRYYLLRILKIPQPTTPAMALGDLLHRVLETKNQLSERELILRLEIFWGDYANILGSDKSLAISLVKNYSKSKFNAPSLDVERSCSFFLSDEIKVKCRFDRVYRDNGTIHIVDWKTGFAPLTRASLEQHPQTQCYLMAGLKEWPDLQVKMSYYYLKSDYTITFQYNSNEAKRFSRIVKRKLKSGFEKKESQKCKFCPVREQCSPNINLVAPYQNEIAQIAAPTLF